jgi:hypothetical protein
MSDDCNISYVFSFLSHFSASFPDCQIPSDYRIFTAYQIFLINNAKFVKTQTATVYHLSETHASQKAHILAICAMGFCSKTLVDKVYIIVAMCDHFMWHTGKILKV